MKTYRAEAVRDGAFWSVRVPEIERTTQARSLNELELMTRDLIHEMTVEPRPSFNLAVTVWFDGEAV